MLERFKAPITILLICLCFFTPRISYADDYTYIGGRGYSTYRTCPNLAAGTALAVVALAAIIAVAVQNGGNNEHCHPDIFTDNLFN